MNRNVETHTPMLCVGYVDGDFSPRSIVTQKSATGDVTKGTITFNVDSKNAKAAGCTHIGFWFYINTSNTATQVGDYADFTDFQIEIGDTATAYEPYHGNTFNLDLGQTVYGGCLDWKTGVLTIDRGIYDLGDFTWAE